MESLAFPKPKDKKREPKLAYRIFADGRIVFNMTTKAGRDGYAANVRSMWERQGRKCGLQISPQCKVRNGRLLIAEAQFDHDNGRGMGGAKRDDRIVDREGNPIGHAVCCWCNCLKGSRRLSDFEEIVP